ncbi:MAG: ABC transporter permease subunit [Planctomycetales bacterium]
MYFDPKAFDFWPAFVSWASMFGSLLLGVAGVVLVLSIILNGVKGFSAFFRGLKEGFADLFFMSPRRIWAITNLTIKESVRRKTLMVIVVFGVCFLFAGWFLSSARDQEVRTTAANSISQTVEVVDAVNVYVSFVLTAISYLILPAVFILACWTIPDDIKIRSIHTVVTKPVRRSEIYVGRVLGITIVGTVIIAVMSGVGYLWLLRALKTEREHNRLVARVPTYGTLSFLDKDGNKADKGINTGDIWEFRSYIEGNTKARAIWEFDGITPQRMNDTLRIESNIQVFRSYRGDLRTGILCQLTFVNPAKGIRAPYPPFPIKEFHLNVLNIRRDELFSDQNKQVDLFNDLVDNGKLRVEVACLSGQQYLGMARPDLFIRMPDAAFATGFFKAVLGTWQMMFMLVVLGVTASCFVKGPVATLLTLTAVVVGKLARGFLVQLVDQGEIEKSGGPLEAVYRIVTHMNVTVPLDDTPWTKVMRGIDHIFKQWLISAKYAIPDFQFYDLAPYIANGYDVPWNSALLPGLSTTLAYLLPCFLLGYFSLKLRELEAK